MPWTAQRTWVTAETITASMLNVMIRDDLNFLYSPPSLFAANDVHQTIPGASSLLIPNLPLIVTDSDGMQATSDEIGNFTAFGSNFVPSRPTSMFFTRTAGKYLITATGAFGAGTDGYRAFGIGLVTGGNMDAIAAVSNTNPGTSSVTFTSRTIWNCAINESIVAWALFAQTGTEDTEFSARYPEVPTLTATWMGN